MTPSKVFRRMFRAGLFAIAAGAPYVAYSDPYFSSYYPEMKYEKCNCSNNKYTKHITQPYKKEIESWFIQTASPKEQATEAGTTCLNCEIPTPLVKQKEDESFWSAIKGWYKSLIKWWKDEDEQPPKPDLKKLNPEALFPKLPLEKQKPDFIPAICFQMSMELQGDTPNSQRDFFTCVHDHYDGSDSDNLCARSKQGQPKKCLALPIPCEDAKDPNLTCKEKFKDREDSQKKTGCNRGAVYPRRPCINEEYTAMTAKAFHDVAECLNVPLDMAFSILNHESRFILNNESSTGALCYSQVTGPAVADFNSFLKGKPHYPEIPELLPENIKKKCPATWKHFKKVHTKYRKKNKRFEIASTLDKCKLNLNPYTCFFYGLSYLKVLTAKAEEALQKHNHIEYTKYKDWTFIFKDQAEKERTENKLNQKLNTKQTNIFIEEEALKKWLVMIGYNGGLSIPTSLFAGFMNQTKAYLSDPKNSQERIQLLAKGLSASRFKKGKRGFISYVRRNYPQGRRRKKEVANYMTKIENDLNSLSKARQERYDPSQPADICPR